MPLMPSEESLEVLLVDDELSTREILEQFCRSRNLAVTVASDGRAAITAIERNPQRFTIILTDINMPGADGFEVLKAAKASNRESYVVMITGYATLDTALRAVREGAYDYLAKPFSLGQLDVMLARIKDRIALERENRDLRRRLQGVKGGAAAPALAASPAQPTYAPPSNVLRSSVLPAAGAAAGRPAAAAAAATAAAPAGSPDIANRVGTMEERLARMEDLLRAAITPR
jgi:CheY-like chemotaxis protein